jgi:hypothetical protein
MNIEITKAQIPSNVKDTKHGRTKYPFDDLPVVDPDNQKAQPCLYIEGERNASLALIRMRGVAREKKYRFLTERVRDKAGKLTAVRIWRTA